jgi:hypothetical protein
VRLGEDLAGLPFGHSAESRGLNYWIEVVCPSSTKFRDVDCDVLQLADSNEARKPITQERRNAANNVPDELFASGVMGYHMNQRGGSRREGQSPQAQFIVQGKPATAMHRPAGKGIFHDCKMVRRH